MSNLGLVSAIEVLTREFGERAGVKVHAELQAVKLRSGAELTVYRLVQEAVTNLSKYAKAQQVWVKLLSRNGMVVVSVRDDGVGFDPEALAGTSNGLVSMRFRIEAERGTLQVASAPGKGTTIEATLPESA